MLEQFLARRESVKPTSTSTAAHAQQNAMVFAGAGVLQVVDAQLRPVEQRLDVTQAGNGILEMPLPARAISDSG
jgi:hypothetical protein